jgi:hypothetical protein
VSKRKNSPYRSGRSPDWLKMKNPEASAVKREAEGRLGQKEMTVGATMDDPQELLNTARRHCQAIQTIIDQLTETVPRGHSPKREPLPSTPSQAS